MKPSKPKTTPVSKPKAKSKFTSRHIDTEPVAASVVPDSATWRRVPSGGKVLIAHFTGLNITDNYVIYAIESSLTNSQILAELRVKFHPEAVFLDAGLRKRTTAK